MKVYIVTVSSAKLLPYDLITYIIRGFSKLSTPMSIFTYNNCSIKGLPHDPIQDHYYTHIDKQNLSGIMYICKCNEGNFIPVN